MQDLESVMNDRVEHLLVVLELKKRDRELVQGLQLDAAALDGLKIRHSGSVQKTRIASVRLSSIPGRRDESTWQARSSTDWKRGSNRWATSCRHARKARYPLQKLVLKPKVCAQKALFASGGKVHGRRQSDE